MSRLSSVEESLHAERRDAIRWLLRRPLLRAADHPEAYALVLRNRVWLATWFAEKPGWKLVVDTAGRFARLHKVPGREDATRPAEVATRTFDRRRYSLLCLALAALDGSRGQVTLAGLARDVGELAADPEGGIRPFDATVAAERRALVEALRLLADLGVLRVRDGDAEGYAQSRDGDVLYDVDDRLLGQFLSAPNPPAWAGAPERLLDEHLPDTAEGETIRARQVVLRRLLEDPVLYYDELSEAERGWLEPARGFLYRVLGDDVGLPVERRREGLAAIDPTGTVSDRLFPDGGSTAKHAALLLAAAFVDRRRTGTEAIEPDDVVEIVAALQTDYGATCNWSKAYPPTADGASRLAEDALAILEGFRLVARGSDGRWAIRPAIARFAPGAATPAAKGRRRR